jgi:hypothetical protein
MEIIVMSDPTEVTRESLNAYLEEHYELLLTLEPKAYPHVVEDAIQNVVASILRRIDNGETVIIENLTGYFRRSIYHASRKYMKKRIGNYYDNPIVVSLGELGKVIPSWVSFWDDALSTTSLDPSGAELGNLVGRDEP